MKYEEVCLLQITSEFEEYLDFIQKLLDEKEVAYIIHPPYVRSHDARYGLEILIIRPKEEKE